MERRINSYILLIVLLSNLLVAFTVLLFLQNLAKKTIKDEKERLTYRISKEFGYLESTLLLVEKQVYKDYQEQIMQIGNQLVQSYPNPQTVPLDTLKKIAYSLHIDHIYLVTRDGTTVNSTSDEQMNKNLENSSPDFSRFFDNLFISHQVNAFILGFSKTNKNINIYTYYVPDNGNYAIKTSISILDFLKMEYPELLSSGSFFRIQELIPHERKIVREIDIFSYDEEPTTSIFNDKKTLPLESNQLKTLLANQELEIKTKLGVQHYQLLMLNSNKYTVPVKLILYFDYNYDVLYQPFQGLFVALLIVIIITLLVISYISPMISERYLVRKISIINHNLNSIRKTDYNDLKTFTGNDELSAIVENIAILKDSVMEREENYKEAKIQAQMADKLKSAFLANMSHEIRTPLNAVVGFAQLLRDANPSPQDAERYIELINTNSYRLLQLISDIIDLSQIQSGQLKIMARPVCLKEMFSELYGIANSKIFGQNQLINNKTITVLVETGELEAGDCMITDPYRLKQVMEQLIDNAVKFTCKGEICIGYKLQGDKITFYVTDTGVGIPQEHLTKVFDRFVQAEDHMTREYGGTGLGLAICRELVGLMGGTIEVESILHQGSTFKFSLPYRIGQKI